MKLKRFISSLLQRAIDAITMLTDPYTDPYCVLHVLLNFFLFFMFFFLILCKKHLFVTYSNQRCLWSKLNQIEVLVRLSLLEAPSHCRSFYLLEPDKLIRKKSL